MKEKYKNLESKYFKLENSRTNKLEELQNIYNNKKVEEQQLESLQNIYLKHEINNLDYFKLKGIEMKIMNSFELIKERKQKLLTKQMNKIDCRKCLICYEKEIKILIKACNHLCVCTDCSEKVDSCPICREKIIVKELIKFN